MPDEFGSILFLLLFAISIVTIYLAVRRRWLRLANASVIGGAVNVVLLTLYSTSEGNSFFQAFTIGLALGLVFTLMAVSAGAYFQARTAEKAAKQPTK